MLPAACRMAAAKDDVLICVVALLGGLAPEGCARGGASAGPRLVEKRFLAAWSTFSASRSTVCILAFYLREFLEDPRMRCRL